MKVLNFLIFAITSFIFLFVSLSVSFAQEVNTPAKTEVTNEKVNPKDGFSYVQKRLGEKIKFLLLSLSPNNKENFYKEVSGRRLAELKYVIENKDLNSFEKATIRYSTTVGEWTEYILKSKLDEKKKPAIEVLTSHLPVVEKLMTTYDGTTAEWRFVKQDADYLRIYISKLQN